MRAWEMSLLRYISKGELLNETDLTGLSILAAVRVFVQVCCVCAVRGKSDRFVLVVGSFSFCDLSGRVGTQAIFVLIGNINMLCDCLLRFFNTR